MGLSAFVVRGPGRCVVAVRRIQVAPEGVDLLQDRGNFCLVVKNPCLSALKEGLGVECAEAQCHQDASRAAEVMIGVCSRPGCGDRRPQTPDGCGGISVGAEPGQRPAGFTGRRSPDRDVRTGTGDVQLPDRGVVLVSVQSGHSVHPGAVQDPFPVTYLAVEERGNHHPNG